MDHDERVPSAVVEQGTGTLCIGPVEGVGVPAAMSLKHEARLVPPADIEGAVTELGE